MDSPSKLSKRCSSGSTPSSTLAEVGELQGLAGAEIVDPDLVRLGRCREPERDAGAVRREDEVLSDPVRRQGEAVDPRVAVLVRLHEQLPSFLVAEAGRVPARLVDGLPHTSGDVVAGNGERIASLVRCDVEECAVGRPDGSEVLGRTVVRSDVDDLAALGSEQEQVRVAAQLTELLGDDPAAVRGDLAGSAPAAELEVPLPSVVQPADDDVEVEAVATVGRVGEQRAVARGVRRGVDVARIHNQGLAVEIELRPLVSALVDLEQQAVVREQLPVDRLGIVRQLLELATVKRQSIELARAGEVGGHEQPGAVARPRQRVGLPQLEQRPQIRHSLRLSAAAQPATASSGMISSPNACSVSS